MIGISGASGTGKTTLALAVSKKMDIPFVQSSARRYYERLGISSGLDVSFAKRVEYQNGILDDAVELYGKQSGIFITDRTPVDYMAYLLADVSRENLTEEETALVLKYVNRCIHVTNAYFMTIVVLQPGLKMIDDGVRITNGAHAEHIAAIILGLVTDQRIACFKNFINRSTIDLDKRVSVIDNVINTTTKAMMKQVSGQIIH